MEINSNKIDTKMYKTHTYDTYYKNILQLIANLKASNKLTKHTHTYTGRQTGTVER